MINYKLILPFALALGISCAPETRVETKCSDVNIMTINDDLILGAQVAAEIDANSTEYPLLDSVKYKIAYEKLYAIRNSILNGTENGINRVKFKDKLPWRLRIINKDVLNAFCTPGGYIYIYTGLIKFLGTEDELAGVMGHEMGHADLRHSTDAITRQYGLEVVSQVILGKNQGVLTQIAKNLATLSYSRCHETQADESSVYYLGGTPYKCNGAAGFFQKLDSTGQKSATPVFLSTHPNPGNRIVNINNRSTKLGCNITKSGDTNGSYSALKASLP